MALCDIFVRFDWLMWHSVVKVLLARFKPSHILINEVQLWFFPTGVPFSMRRTPLADEKVHQTLLEVLTRVTHSRAHRVSFSFTEEEREKIRFVYRRASSFTLVGQGLSLSLCNVKHRRKISSRKNLDKQSYFVLSVYFYTLSILVSRVDALYIVVYKRTDVCVPRFACLLLCSFLSWASTLCRTTS